MASTTYSTYPTQRNFIDQPTGSGGSTVIEYVGYAGATSPIIYRTSGTGTWTFVLPPPSQYTLLPGTRFEFLNNSTGLVTINASDNTLIGTVAPGASTQFTQTGSGSTNASWGTSSPNTISGILPVANGGTGQATANAGFNAISPMTTAGDMIYGGVSGAATRFAAGTTGQTLTSNGNNSAPQWLYGGTGSIGTISPAFTSPGGVYTVVAGSYVRSVSNLPSTIGTYACITNVNIAMKVVTYPTGFNTGVGFSINLPFNGTSVSPQYIVGTIISSAAVIANVELSITANSSTMTINYPAIKTSGGGFVYTANDLWYLNFAYSSA
jgi:hypothetical protein